MDEATLPSAEARPRSERGFSMAEVLVAVALLSVILLALFGLVTAGVRRTLSGRTITEATLLAQAVMERANVAAPQAAFNAAAADPSATITWEKRSSSDQDSAVFPAAEASGAPAGWQERNAWRELLRTSGLPGFGTEAPSTLTVTMSAQPTGDNFGNCAFVRIMVEVRWYEATTRRTMTGSAATSKQRVVRLQTYNVRTTEL